MNGQSPKLSIGARLSQSSKGQLTYVRNWPENGKAVTELLDEWTSPPVLPKRFLTSPMIGGETVKARTRSDQSDDGYSMRDGVIHMKTSTPKIAAGNVRSTSENNLTQSNSSSADRRIVVLNQENEADSLNLSLSPNYGRTELAIKQCESLWEQKAQEATEQRRRLFEEESRRLWAGQQEELLKLEVDELKKWENIKRNTADHIKEQNQEISRNLQKLKDHHLSRKKFIDGVVKTVEGKKVQLEEEAKQQQLEAQKRFQTLMKIHSQLMKTQEELSMAYKTCQYKEHLPEPARKFEDLLSQLKHKAESIIQQAQTQQASVEHIRKLHEVSQQAQNALEYLSPLVEDANRKGELGKPEKEKQNVQVPQEEQASITATTTTANTVTPGPAAEPAQTRERGPSLSEEAQVAPEKAFEAYIKLQTHLKQVEKSLEELSKNPQMKQYKFDLQKSVNTPVNAISPVSGEHLRDKLLRLVKLLGGHTVEVGTKKVSAKDHPLGILFCKNLLARMLVKKADEQVSSIHESAFAIAMVTVGVWTEHQDLGDLLLAHFQAACPYLVPYYVPQLEGQTTDQHLQAQGYKFVNGTVERQDKFLKRMSGLMRLYAAIMVSCPPRSQSTHPYSIEHAWIWLTNVMNMPPHPDITATLIFDLLEVAGHAMYRAYHKQFQKLLHHLLTVYLPKIEAVIATGGPVARLKTFLETCIKHGGQVPLPEGFLEQKFWYT